MNRPGKETPRQLRACVLIAALATALCNPPAKAADRQGRVTVVATPDGGIQPQAVADQAGVVHVIYFKGDPGHGDLFYVRNKPGTTEFSMPLRVNSQPGSAIAMGTIRGGQLALGRNGRVHVAWNGSDEKVAPPNPIKGVPMLYARLNEDRSAFEPQRNLMHRAFYLD